MISNLRVGVRATRIYLVVVGGEHLCGWEGGVRMQGYGGGALHAVKNSDMNTAERIG